MNKKEVTLKRRIENDLQSWKLSKRRKPLIIKGARQVGKTWSINKFASDNFNQVIVIDLEKRRNWHSFFKEDLDPNRIIQNIELALAVKITPGETLLFFDEIQSCPEAIMALRYFYEELPELHIIAAGSLLEFVLSKISVPVGRLQYLNMYPMTFSEFLEAQGNLIALEVINSKPEKLPNSTHNLLISLLREYFLVGGMPESVQAFIDSKNFAASGKVQNEIVLSYIDDFARYAPYSNKLCLEEVLINSSKNIGNQQNYTRLSYTFSHPTIKKAFELLVKARLIHKISSIGILEFPLTIQSSTRKFKTIMLDIGIWQQLSGVPMLPELSNTNLMNGYRGALAEQFIGQELIATISDHLHYWARNAKSSNAEVDYVITQKNEIYPIEVKSGAAGSLKSLHLALKTYPFCKEGIVFSTREYSEIPEQKLKFIPLYYAGSFSTFL